MQREIKGKALSPQQFVEHCEAMGVSKIVICAGQKCPLACSYNLDNIRANGDTIIINEGDPANNIAYLQGVDFLIQCPDTEYNDALYECGFTGFFVCKSCDNDVGAAADWMIRVR
jgi:hypothetical protein